MNFRLMRESTFYPIGDYLSIIGSIFNLIPYEFENRVTSRIIRRFPKNDSAKVGGNKYTKGREEITLPASDRLGKLETGLE